MYAEAKVNDQCQIYQKSVGGRHFESREATVSLKDLFIVPILLATEREGGHAWDQYAQS